MAEEFFPVERYSLTLHHDLILGDRCIELEKPVEWKYYMLPEKDRHTLIALDDMAERMKDNILESLTKDGYK